MTTPSRNSVFWWLYVALLAGAALFIAHSFVEILVIGLFGYYATRPICSFLERVLGSESHAAALTVLAVLLPVLALAVYTAIRAFQQVQRLFDESVISMLTSELFGLEAVPDTDGNGLESLLRNPPSLDQVTDLLSGPVVQEGLHAADVVFGALMVMALGVTLAYGLLENDGSIADGFATLAGGRDTTVYSYALAVDTDLENIFFGNLLFVLVMSVIATAAYATTNLVAPSGLQVPMVFTLGVLTGIASLIPIVVGKIVYLPVVAYLGLTAAEEGGGQLAFVGGVLVFYFLALDIVPQSFIQPYISGRQLDALILLFAYLLGPMLFGWYGFFLLPIVFVLMLELVRIVLPELLHGEPIVSEPDLAEGTGASAEEMHDGGDGEGAASSDGGTDTDRE